MKSEYSMPIVEEKIKVFLSPSDDRLIIERLFMFLVKNTIVMLPSGKKDAFDSVFDFRIVFVANQMEFSFSPKERYVAELFERSKLLAGSKNMKNAADVRSRLAKRLIKKGVEAIGETVIPLFMKKKSLIHMSEKVLLNACP